MERIKRGGYGLIFKMGLFDRVILKCPNCKGFIEFQSKGGKCILNNYTLKNVPWDVILSIDKKIVKCPTCSKNVKLEITNLPKKPNIKLKLTKIEAHYSGETTID